MTDESFEPPEDPDRSLLGQYLLELKWRNYRPGTVDQRRRALRRFARWLAPKPVIDATTGDIIAFLGRRHRAGGELSAETRGAERSNLQAYFRWANDFGHRADNPVARVPKVRLPRRLPRPISEDDLLRALDDAPERVRPWYYLAGFAGLRACEIAPLRGEDLWWHYDPPLLHIREGKGGHAGTVPIAPVLAEVLHELPKRGWLFPRLDGEPGPVKPHLVSQLANRHLHSLHIWETLHSLRHRFGTQVYRASGRDIRQTQELMRHRSIVSTAIYTAVDPEEAAATVAGLPAPEFR